MECRGVIPISHFPRNSQCLTTSLLTSSGVYMALVTLVLSGRTVMRVRSLIWALSEVPPVHIAPTILPSGYEWSSMEMTLLAWVQGLPSWPMRINSPVDLKLNDKDLLGEFDGCIREIRILNRILRLTESGLRYEADPRHAEMLVKALGLSSASSVLTPGVEENNDLTNYDADLTDEHVALEQWGH